MVDETDGADVAILCTTSGTTSNPKLAEWTGTAFIGHAATYLRADPRDSDDEYVAVLPLSWVMEQMYSVAWNFIARMKVNFPEEEQTMMADLREIGPTFVLLSPRVWEIGGRRYPRADHGFAALEATHLPLGRRARHRCDEERPAVEGGRMVSCSAISVTGSASRV